MLHIRYQGQSQDIPLEDLDLGDMSSDADIKQAVADHFSKPVATLESFTVDRNDGEITLRPQAIFGEYMLRRQFLYTCIGGMIIPCTSLIDTTKLSPRWKNTPSPGVARNKKENIIYYRDKNDIPTIKISNHKFYNEKEYENLIVELLDTHQFYSHDINFLFKNCEFYNCNMKMQLTKSKNKKLFYNIMYELNNCKFVECNTISFIS